MNQPSFRDVEMLSAYLDGQLSQVDSTRVETRIKADPGLRSVYDDLRESRSLLRKLPARRAPRNFTLTPKMAGLKPPLPRAFPLFRLGAALAAILLFFSYAANLSVPALAALRAGAPASYAYGMGGGGGGSDQPPAAAMLAPAATDTAAAPQALAPLATQAPLAAETAAPETIAPALALTATPEASAPQDNALPAAPAPQTGAQPKLDPYAQNNARTAAASQPLTLPVQPAWLFGLLALLVLSGGAAVFVRARVERDWRKAHAVQARPPAVRDWLLFGLALLVVLLLAAGIYWMSTTTFYAPVAQAPAFPSGPVSDAKGAGPKGAPPSEGPQQFHVSPGLGYGFSATDAAGLVTAIDFPVDAVKDDADLAYIPGLDTLPPDGVLFFSGRAFTLMPLPKSVVLQTPVTVTLEYDRNTAAAADGRPLSLYWWSGSAWMDAAATCTPTSNYERLPDSSRIRVAVCQFGSFLLVAP